MIFHDIPLNPSPLILVLEVEHTRLGKPGKVWEVKVDSCIFWGSGKDGEVAIELLLAPILMAMFGESLFGTNILHILI